MVIGRLASAWGALGVPDGVLDVFVLVFRVLGACFASAVAMLCSRLGCVALVEEQLMLAVRGVDADRTRTAAAASVAVVVVVSISCC